MVNVDSNKFSLSQFNMLAFSYPLTWLVDILFCMINFLLKCFQGRDYCFVSNIDNLGATVDLNIFNLMVNNPSGTSTEFLMEVTDKTKADVKVCKKKLRNVGLPA